MTAYESHRRARLLDRIHALAVDAASEAERDRLTCPLTTPRPARAFADEAEPIYVDLVAELGVPGQDTVGPGPVVVAEPPTTPLRLLAGPEAVAS